RPTAAAAAAPVQFAAAELQGDWLQLTGLHLPIVHDSAAARGATLSVRAPGPQAGTPAPPPAGGFGICPDDGGFALTGDSPRALLDAVYALLEQCGCRWSLHGVHEEVVPRLTTAVV